MADENSEEVGHDINTTVIDTKEDKKTKTTLPHLVFLVTKEKQVCNVSYCD